ncbi:MAG: type II toxin-antitoxin system VapC family toxin [Patescibacteria group bacterium]
MKKYLLDSNIVIYYLHGEPKVLSAIENMTKANACFYISMITWIEVLAGSFKHEKSIDDMASEMDAFAVLPIDKVTGMEAGRLLQTSILSGRKENFPDAVIAATAIVNDIPLLTNNPRDFKPFRGLKLV